MSTAQTKTCIECRVLKSITEYASTTGRKCIDCKKGYKSEKMCQQCKVIKKANEFESPSHIKCFDCSRDNVKTCAICGQTKARELFPKVGAKCLDCRNELARETRLKDKEREQTAEIVDKTCHACGFVKKSTEFRFNRGTCMDCNRKQNREYKSNSDVKEKTKQQDKERKTIALAKQQAIEDMVKHDLVYKIRARTSYVLTKIAQDIHDDTVNCTVPFLRRWFALNFADGMSFQNYGTVWNIDHVIPLESFDLSDEKQKRLASSWYNLSPYCVRKNETKKQNIDTEQLFMHVEMLKQIEIGNEISVDPEYYNLCATQLVAGNP